MIGIKDCECQLLGAWLLDYHREHIKDFEYFSVYVDIFKAIKESTKIDMVTVANKAKCSVTEIAEITSQYMPSLYTSSYKFVKKHQIQMRLESLKNSPDDIVTQIDQLHKEIEKLTKEIGVSESRLNNEDYVKRAPQDIVEKERERLQTTKIAVQKLTENLNKIKSL